MTMGAFRSEAQHRHEDKQAKIYDQVNEREAITDGIYTPVAKTALALPRASTSSGPDSPQAPKRDSKERAFARMMMLLSPS